MDPLSGEKLVIRPKRSRKAKFFSVVTYVLILLVAVSLAAYAGFWFGTGDLDRNSIKLDKLQKEHKELSSKHDKLLLEEAKLVQSQNVQQSAYVELEKNYELIDQRNEFLNRRVNFYRSILSPKDGISGVRIHDVSLVEEKNNIYFEIILIQSINHEREAGARVFVELFETKQDRKPIVAWKAKTHDYKFKFSETISGVLTSEQSLNGKLLKIIVLPNGDSSKQLVEWHKV